ncbi:hypothetical protein GF337_18980 [candidate division KSB1 bacterium]|nr:hypothetical protein [candidate division KSB1 bacterium]
MGDFIIWKQIIEFANDDGINALVFVTDDDKEDWWLKIGNNTIGPHPELVDEILHEAKLDQFYMYNSERFLKYANKYLDTKISEDTLIEVRDVSQLTHASNKMPPNTFKIIAPTETEVNEEYIEVVGTGAIPGRNIILVTSLHGLYLAPQLEDQPIADSKGNWQHSRCHLFNRGKRWIYALAVREEDKERVLHLLKEYGESPVEDSISVFEDILKDEGIPYQITLGKYLIRRGA